MHAALEFAPLVAFIAAYYFAGIYAATATLMAAMALLLLIDWVRQRTIPSMHLISAVLVFVFGSATLLLHDQRFIQWKPTVMFWALAVAFAGSVWIGAKPLAQRLMEAAMPDARIERRHWLAANWAWVLFYLVMGAVNLLVARAASEQLWVNFKVFGITGLTLVFVVAQAMWLGKRSAA